ncbi:glycosyl transferase family 2 [Solidesulfovibrio fructosivorans JJ]]|uniref:Glycosyl transferase family 2 n=1 Tax=Solidesulfovibrio fructosivorans JJ] TaxID=596151 RepID=E1JY85_SOLFR|nr:glycosyltransferase family 2 protein [Solidesulfovibrio fructosivorans]EFL50659.1 glycosyl transferase family 2 [Solidesulfovibrio fructosivorans JJ]]
MPQRPVFISYPPPGILRRMLPLWAFGLEGPWLARRLGADMLAAARDSPKLAGLADAMAAWNFERAPLDGAFAANALAAARRKGASARRRALCAALAKATRPPKECREWPRLRDGTDTEAGAAFLARAMDDAAHGSYWRGKAFDFALARGLPDLARRVADALAADPALAPVGARLAVEAAFAWDGPAAGLAALSACDRGLFPRFYALALAQGLAETGRTGEATAVLADLWRAENWHPGLTLRLHTLLFPPAPADLDAMPGRLFVFLYTWNRAGLLARTLESLAASHLGPARVVVLDNGGTDDTQSVCRAAAVKFAPDRFAAIRLPVNIGAPAARNWLAATARLERDDLAAYVDDDVSLPADWLARLAGALRDDAQADVAGARVVAAAPGAAAGVQAADVRLLPPDAANTVRPLVNYGPGPDFGLCAAHRPCPSVSGCCHLLRGSALGDGAPFDIRFSPSQFDDLARDLGGFLAGRRAVYAGDLAVAHHQHAGPGQARTRAAVGQLRGARTKLDGLFAASDMAVAAARDANTAWAELETKWREAREATGCALSRAGSGAD